MEHLKPEEDFLTLLTPDHTKKELKDQIEKRRNDLVKIRLRQWATIGLGVVCFLGYILLDSANIRSIEITGNDYHNKEDLLAMVDFPSDAPFLLVNTQNLAARFAALPLVEGVKVYKNKYRQVWIDISYEPVLGYFVDTDTNLLLTNGEVMRLDETMMDVIAYVPLFYGFETDDLVELGVLFSEISQDVISTISEVVPHATSYDERMVKLTTQEGLTIFSSRNSLFLLNEYRSILPSLSKENNCLYLDGVNSAIVSEACEEVEDS
ncbi:MAG: cell division protein FtsQ/DivIB [Erysipelotrichaceae bacterium]